MNQRWFRQFAEFQLVFRNDDQPRTTVRVGKLAIGPDTFTVMAGPCSVESERQLLATAEAVASAGAQILRGGAFKPRSSPYSFQGLGLEGLKLLAKARRATGLAIVTEVMSELDVAMVAEYADVLQIGTRNMDNWAQLEAAAISGRAILLKRGTCARIEDLMRSAQFVLSCGNPNVMLCERGIRTFEDATRNTFDISAVPVLNAITHLPVIVDPSHAAGCRELVPSLARAATVIGADGLLVEVHPEPERALSDGDQSLTFAAFETMMRDVERCVSFRESLKGAPVQAMAEVV